MPMQQQGHPGLAGVCQMASLQMPQQAQEYDHL
jgi:hypothetical protein